MRILVVGGYGTFGGRLVDLLSDEPLITLIVAGRSIERACAFCATRAAARAKLESAEFDRGKAGAAQLAALRPDLVVDASGPFQAYGDSRYALVEACIANGVNYLDLADASDFVAGISCLDEAAKAAGVFALSGVSTFPVLSSAAVRHLAAGLNQVLAIRGGIAPSPYAGVGGNVIRAIAGYAGKPIRLRRNGVDAIGHPFAEQMRYTIAPPGCVPLESRLFSLVDVPDLRLFGELWPEVRGVWMGAAPVPTILHRALIALAWCVRLRLLPSALPFAPLMEFASNRLRWGEHRGGMFVEVEGTDSNRSAVRASWHLLAEGDCGPLIPSMAVEAIVRGVLEGRKPPSGARACVNDVTLDDYERLFAKHAIRTGTRREIAEDRG